MISGRQQYSLLQVGEQVACLDLESSVSTIANGNMPAPVSTSVSLFFSPLLRPAIVSAQVCQDQASSSVTLASCLFPSIVRFHSFGVLNVAPA